MSPGLDYRCLIIAILVAGVNIKCGEAKEIAMSTRNNSGDCADEVKNCVLWAENGECKEFPEFMKRHCAFSCGLCKVENVCQTEPKSNFVTLYEHPNREGASVKQSLDSCCSLSRDWRDRASSLDTDAGCVKVFTGTDCHGEHVFIKSNFDNIHLVGWGDRIESTYKCAYE